MTDLDDLITGLREHLNEMPISFNENVWQVRSKREMREAHDRATIEHQATRDKVRKLLDALAVVPDAATGERVKKIILESLVFTNENSDPWAQLLTENILAALDGAPEPEEKP